MPAIRSLLLVAAISLISVGSARAGFITNGGFETGDFTGWSGPLTTDTFTSIVGSPVHSGSFAAEFGPVGGISTMSQTFTDGYAVFGDTLTISLWAQNNSSSGPSEFKVVLNGATLIDLVNPPAFGYTNFVFTAPALTSNTLDIGFRQDPSFMHLDDVSVTGSTATPVPPTAAFMLIGGIGIVAARVRRRLLAA